MVDREVTFWTLRRMDMGSQVQEVRDVSMQM